MMLSWLRRPHVVLGELQRSRLFSLCADERFRTNERLLIELVLSRSNSDIEILKKAYTKRWGKSLMEEVKADTSGPVQTSELPSHPLSKVLGLTGHHSVHNGVDGAAPSGSTRTD